MPRDKIKLESSAGTGHFYTTSKNKKNMPDKMEIMKFDPVARKHVKYKETKLKKQRFGLGSKKSPRIPRAFCRPEGAGYA